MTLGVLLIFLEVYLHYFAPRPLRIGVEGYHIDKFLHFLGGIFLMMAFEWKYGTWWHSRRSFWFTILFTLGAIVLWKGYEFFSDPSAQRFILTHLETWSLDFIGDTSATILGSLFYWRLVLPKPVLEIEHSPYS